MTRRHNGGVRKLCDCARTNWPKCSHPWHFNYKPRGGQAYRFSFDAEVGKHIEKKTDAEKLANDIRSAINDGTFVRAADRRRHAALATPSDVLTVAQLGETYFKTYRNRKTAKPLSKNERYRWDLILRTEIDRPNGRMKFGEVDVRAVTRHDVEAFKATHLVRRVEVFKDVKGPRAWLEAGRAGRRESLFRAFARVLRVGGQRRLRPGHAVQEGHGSDRRVVR